MRLNWLRNSLPGLACLLLLAIAPAAPEAAIPITGQAFFDEDTTGSPSSALDSFVFDVSDGQAGVVRGVFAPNALALRVVQQPEANPLFISYAPGAVTQYRYAAYTNVIGLLAHKEAAGALFFNLRLGQELWLVYGDSARQSYLVSNIFRYQALQPNNVRSQFVNLDSGEVLSSGQLYERVYRGEPHLTFQTCIERDGVAAWGRLFVIAVPLGELIPALDAGLDMAN